MEGEAYFKQTDQEKVQKLIQSHTCPCYSGDQQPGLQLFVVLCSPEADSSKHILMPL